MVVNSTTLLNSLLNSSDIAIPHLLHLAFASSLFMVILLSQLWLGHAAPAISELFSSTKHLGQSQLK